MKPGPLTRAALLAAGAATGAYALPAAAIEISQLSLARMARPFTGGTAAPLSEQDRRDLDQLGNRNGFYDIGDIRMTLYTHPQLIPSGVVHTQRTPR